MLLSCFLLTPCCFPGAVVSWSGLHGGNTNLRNCWVLYMFVTTSPRLQFSLPCANPAVCGAVLSAGSGKQSELKIAQGGWGWQVLQPSDVICCHKSARAACNCRKTWKPSLGDTYLLQEIWTFQPAEGPLWMMRQESFARARKERESKPHCAQMPAENLFTQALLQQFFIWWANGSVCYSADVYCLFCGLRRKLPWFLSAVRVLQLWGCASTKEENRRVFFTDMNLTASWYEVKYQSVHVFQKNTSSQL